MAAIECDIFFTCSELVSRYRKSTSMTLDALARYTTPPPQP